ncbi:N-acetyl-gamma-glutamyl-phosphate reductase [Saccharicrinis sp. FJH2]|uniref:N-acetyl-gamma-glutamyl-phosphate reductase n=1 Tax=Saccharicrinis sp. FJH65 TaxID=3344659 RepID=UPI0035F342A2
MIRTGIIGGAGYTAGELIRILMHHPDAEIVFIHSNSNAGNPVTNVHTDLLGETEQTFTDELNFDSVDVIFLCMGHGASKTFVESHGIPEHVKIIDLSHDYRLNGDHDFVYGLPELQKEEIVNAKHIANPGCFATAIQLALLPLAANLMLTTDVHVHAVTGSTGAGQKPTATSHFSWRNGNISVYKAFEHQHLGEINQSLVQLQSSFNKDLNFVPVRGNFTRGILASAYTTVKSDLEDVVTLYKAYYKDHPFVIVTDKNPDVKQVVNTNKCLLYLQKYGDKLHVVSIIDNLVKGASGQAVQNMNLMYGLEETTGLWLKATAF